jgi:hypothetical protein
MYFALSGSNLGRERSIHLTPCCSDLSILKIISLVFNSYAPVNLIPVANWVALENSDSEQFL